MYLSVLMYYPLVRILKNLKRITQVYRSLNFLNIKNKRYIQLLVIN